MKPVEVTWLDANTDGGWLPREDYAQKKLVECKSVGYLLRKDPKCVVLLQSLESKYGQGSDSIVIPRQTLKRIRHLR